MVYCGVNSVKENKVRFVFPSNVSLIHSLAEKLVSQTRRSEKVNPERRSRLCFQQIATRSTEDTKASRQHRRTVFGMNGVDVLLYEIL